MTVANLIEKLKEMPQDASVYHLWDGELRTAIEIVYLSRSGDVVTADYDEVCYSDAARPADAPTRAEDQFWSTPKSPSDNISE